MEQLQYILQIVFTGAIVPFVTWFKNKYIPEDMAFVTWLATFVLCSLGAWGISLFLKLNLDFSAIVGMAVTIMFGSGAIHAAVKMGKKHKAKKAITQ